MSAAAVVSDVLRDPVTVAACSAAAALVLAHALWPKLRDFSGFWGAVSAYRLVPDAWSRPVALAYLGAETASVAALVAAPLHPGAALLAACVVAAASGAVGINLLRGRRDIRCGCGSHADNLRLSNGLLLRNLGLLAVLVLAAIAAAGLAAGTAPRAFTLIDTLAAGFCALALLLLWLGATQLLVNADRAARRTGRLAASHSSHPTHSPSRETPMTALVIANIVLWIAVLALLFGFYALARQVGILFERVAPMGALVIDAGPRVGEALPPFALQDVRGGPVAVGGAQPRSTLLFFLSPTCPVCKKLLPVLKSMQASEAGWLRVVLASDGEQPEHLAFLRQAGLEAFPYVLSPELGMHLQIGKLPYGVLMDERGTLRAKGLVNSREQLESLFTAMDLNVGSVQQFLETRA